MSQSRQMSAGWTEAIAKTTMRTRSPTRILFLDDSGHPAPLHDSRAIVIGGFSIESTGVPTLSRRISGAKGHLYPERGQPARWEIKASETIRPNRWKRRRNRSLVEETLRILRGLDCTAYTVSIDKTRMHHPMEQRTTMPLQLQGLVEHFAVECTKLGEIGLIVMDRSNHPIDAHASHCVASYVSAKELPLHPTVYYADSMTSQAIQIADLIAGSRRRVVEGDKDLRSLEIALAALRPSALEGELTHQRRPWTNRIVLF